MATINWPDPDGTQGTGHIMLGEREVGVVYWLVWVAHEDDPRWIARSTLLASRSYGYSPEHAVRKLLVSLAIEARTLSDAAADAASAIALQGSPQ